MNEEFGYHELERAALGYVLEDDLWPAFLAWMKTHHVSEAAHYWLMSAPDIWQVRADYIAHGPA